MTNTIIALQITVIGMFLIFCVILFLWTLLTLLVFVLGKSSREDVNSINMVSSNDVDEETIRQEAVAAAVSAALSRKSLLAPGNFPLPPTAIVSAWQAVLRGNMLSKRGIPR